jgi:hypothetical protein
MTKGISDISNTAVRIFLQEMGKAYDIERKLPPYSKKHFTEVKGFFQNTCCFCGIDGTSTRLIADHLVPINRTSLGLEAWGNLVPSCGNCNEKKHKRDWIEFLKEVAGEDFQTKKDIIQEFVQKYHYSPNHESISLAVEELYEESGAIAMQLVLVKLRRAMKTAD